MLGKRDGNFEGEYEGLGDGFIVGKGLGIAVGLSVGSTTGTDDIVKLATIAGCKVGLIDGKLIGDIWGVEDTSIDCVAFPVTILTFRVGPDNGRDDGTDTNPKKVWD